MTSTISRFFNRLTTPKYAETFLPRDKFNKILSTNLITSKKKKVVGLFMVPELTNPRGFYILRQDCVKTVDKYVLEALSEDRNRIIIKVFDDISNTLCKVADLAEFIRVAHSDIAFQQAAEITSSELSNVVEKLNTNKELYNALKTAILEKDVVNYSPEEQYLGNLFLVDFEQCGIHLPEEDRDKVVYLIGAINSLGQQFSANCTKGGVLKHCGLKHDLDYYFQYTDCDLDIDDHKSREIAYKAFLQPNASQEETLMKLLEARDELAKVTGFSSYSQRALRGGIFDEPSQVMEFLDILTERLWKNAELDFNTMEKMKQKDVSNSKLESWDIPYYVQKAKRQYFHVNYVELSSYFTLGSCIDGINEIFKQIFGIELVYSEILKGETWATNIFKLSVIHESEGLLGLIYCDLFERSNKPKIDCHFTIKGGKRLQNGLYQMPIVALVMNLANESSTGPYLLHPSMVDNLFHEMGHAIHSMLARSEYQHTTGTRCTTDFGEVPSILMEYFASDIRVLRSIALHFGTTEKMPEDKLQCLCASKHVFFACELQMQIFYSALDQIYHGEHPLKGSSSDVLAETQKKYYYMPYVPSTNWQLKFNHLVGYGAKYYSYLVSRAVAFWIWKTYFEEDPFNRDRGEQYRRQFLAYGGGKNPKQLISDFLKFLPTPEKLADALVQEVQQHQTFTKKIIKMD